MGNKNLTFEEIVLKLKKHTTIQLEGIPIDSLLASFIGNRFFLEVEVGDIILENDEYKMYGYITGNGLTRIHALFNLSEREDLIKINVYDKVCITGVFLSARDKSSYIFNNCIVVKINSDEPN